jgi:hypothetical protein
VRERVGGEARCGLRKIGFRDWVGEDCAGDGAHARAGALRKAGAGGREKGMRGAGAVTAAAGCGECVSENDRDARVSRIYTSNTPLTPAPPHAMVYKMPPG